MPELIGTYPAGTARIKYNGSTIDVFIVIFRTQHREAQPVDTECFLIIRSEDDR